jgi:hypothetical protein
LVPPFKWQSPGSHYYDWSSHVESVWKDVERTFRILKKHFSCLNHPLEWHDELRIRDLFHTCCLLHNWLLVYDGLDDWELTLMEESIDLPYQMEVEQHIIVNAPAFVDWHWMHSKFQFMFSQNVTASTSYEYMGSSAQEEDNEGDTPVVFSSNQELLDRIDDLVSHYIVMKSDRRLLCQHIRDQQLGSDEPLA